jgi:hypothetical protein
MLQASAFVIVAHFCPSLMFETKVEDYTSWAFSVCCNLTWTAANAVTYYAKVQITIVKSFTVWQTDATMLT